MAAAHTESCPMPSTSRLFALSAIVALACALSACKRDKPAEPPTPVVAASAPAPAPAWTREQAMAALLALPEVKAWSERIEKSSRGAAHGAVIEDDPEPRVINGTKYWQFSLVENRRDAVHRKDSFLVAQTGQEILVEDVQNDTVLSLGEWRRNIHRVEIRSAP
jgi:hypothetical protein